jgi:hypothetical protein
VISPPSIPLTLALCPTGWMLSKVSLLNLSRYSCPRSGLGQGLLFKDSECWHRETSSGPQRQNPRTHEGMTPLDLGATVCLESWYFWPSLLRHIQE